MTGPSSSTGSGTEQPQQPAEPRPVRPRPRTRGVQRLPVWMRDWRVLRSILRSWWYSVGGHDLRVAWYDARRAPGWVLLGFIGICWVATDFTLIPVAVAAGAWLGMMWLTRFAPWWTRWRVRRAARPLIGLLALAWLALDAGLWVWILALGLWLVIAGATDTWRARNRLCAWVLASVARSARVDPGQFATQHREWDGRRLVFAEVPYGNDVRVEEPAVRERIAAAVKWSLRHSGGYTINWPPGRAVFEIVADPALPISVLDVQWPEGLPGIPVGVTDEESADVIYEERDEQTGETLLRLPLLLVDPRGSEKHLLVIGGTGAGKSNFTRGYIARALRNGWFPGGVFIFDGKSGSDYIVFENREGVHCVAREPEEWEANLRAASAMMRARYEEDAEYHRGNRDKPETPLFLVVLDEVQEIRAVLGEKVLDPILQQLSRQIRAAGGRLLVATQRPDTADAIPGPVRDMLEDRLILGYVSPTGARMAIPEAWQSVVDEYGAEPVVGRGMARIAGKLTRIQTMRLDLPRDHPELESFYPPKRGQQAGPGGPGGGPGGGGGGHDESGPARSNVIQWAPRKAAADEQKQAAGGAEAEAPTTPQGVPVVVPEQLAQPRAQASHSPALGGVDEDPPRRRRTV